MASEPSADPRKVQHDTLAWAEQVADRLRFERAWGLAHLRRVAGRAAEWWAARESAQEAVTAAQTSPPDGERVEPLAALSSESAPPDAARSADHSSHPEARASTSAAGDLAPGEEGHGDRLQRDLLDAAQAEQAASRTTVGGLGDRRALGSFAATEAEPRDQARSHAGVASTSEPLANLEGVRLSHRPTRGGGMAPHEVERRLRAIQAQVKVPPR